MLKIGSTIIYKTNRKYLGEICFKNNYTIDYPSLLILEEDIIWHHTFAGAIEDWSDNVYRTILYTLTSLLLKNSVKLLVHEQEHILFNKSIVKYTYFSFVNKNKIKSLDLLENDFLKFMELKAHKVSRHNFLRRLIRYVVNENIGTTSMPNREFLKAIVKRNIDYNDWISLVYNPKSFKINDDFTVHIVDIYKNKLSIDYKNINEAIEKKCIENDHFKLFCEELELCVANIVNEYTPNTN